MADYGIAAKVDAPKIDFLGTLGNAQQLKTQMLNNRLLGQQVAGKESLGRIIGANTGPDGVTNYPGASAQAAQDPNAALLLPQFQSDALARQIQEQNLTQAQLATSHQKLSAVSDTAYSLLSNADKVPLTPENVLSGVQQLFSQGILTEQDKPMAAAFIGRLSQDPAQNAVVLKQLYMQTHPNSEGMEALKGHIGATDTGPDIVQNRTSGLPVAAGEGATEVVGQPIQKGLSPGESASPNYNYIDANGVPHMVTKGETFAAQGTGSAPKGTPTGPAAGTVEALQHQKAASADQFTADVNDAGGFAQRMQGLTNAETAIKKAQTGKGGQAAQDWGAIISTFAPGALSDEQKSKIKNFDEAKKYLTDYANRRGAALGMGTDAGREMIHAANPSVDINQAAATDILKVIKGLERMQNAQVAEAQRQGIQPGDYATWRAGWNRTTDPRGFMADQLPAAQRVKLFDALSKPEQAKYARGVKAAIDAGYFTADDLRK